MMPQFGKYNGLGGKLHADEDVVACMRREIREEAGIECESLRLAGTISWPGFGAGGEDWFGFIFRIDRFSGTPFTENAEGTLEWVEIGACWNCRCGKATGIFCRWCLRRRATVSRRDAVSRWPPGGMGLFRGLAATREALRSVSAEPCRALPSAKPPGRG